MLKGQYEMIVTVVTTLLGVSILRAGCLVLMILLAQMFQCAAIVLSKLKFYSFFVTSLEKVVDLICCLKAPLMAF